MGGTSSLRPFEVVLIEVSFAAVIVTIVLCVHLFVKDWASEGGVEEQQRIDAVIRETSASVSASVSVSVSSDTGSHVEA